MTLKPLPNPILISFPPSSLINIFYFFLSWINTVTNYLIKINGDKKWGKSNKFFNIKDKTKDGRGRVGKKGVCLVNDRSVHNHKKTMHGGPLF